MKLDSLKVHSAWALALVGAFFVGSMFQSSSTDQNDISQADQTRNTPVRLSTRDLGMGVGLSGTESRKIGSRGSSEISDSLNLKRLSSNDPDLLAKAAFTDPNPVTRRLAFSKLLESVTVENAAQIRQQLADLGAGGQELRDFNYTWGALGGADAFTTAAAGNKRDLESLISGWAAVDPDGAINMLENLPFDLADQNRRLESGLVAGLADRDQDQAAEYVKILAAAGNENANRLMSTVIGEVLRENGHLEASVWVEGLEDGSLKGTAMDRVAGRYVRNDPEGASQWIEQFAAEDYAAEAVREVGKEWAEKEPLTAVTWLDQLPEGEGQKAGLNSAFGDWEDRDPAAAGEYLNSMPESAKRDSAISGFAIGLAYQEPATAVAWASDISDPNLRESSLIRTGQTYFQRKPDAAKTWLENSGLPQNIQKQILNPPERRRRR